MNTVATRKHQLTLFADSVAFPVLGHSDRVPDSERLFDSDAAGFAMRLDHESATLLLEPRCA
jgi:hypothetical protein